MEIWYPLILLLISLFFLYKFLNRYHGYWQQKGVFSLDPLPIIGNTKDLLIQKFNIAEFMRDMYEKGKGQPYIGLYIFGTPVLLLRSPKIIKDIMQKDFNIFDNRTSTPPAHDKMMQNMIFMAKNPTWKTIRQKLTPTYTSGKLKAMFPLIDQVGEAMTKYLSNNSKEPLDAKELSAKFSHEVISKTAFAIDAGCFDSEDSEFRRWGRKVSEPRFVAQMMIFFAPQLVNIFKPSFMDVGARKFFAGVFKRALKLREQGSAAGNDLIDSLVHLKKNDKTGLWDDDVLLAQAFQVFFAGTETTSQAISYTLYELALQPAIQEKLRNELRQMIEENNGKIEYEALLNLKYLDMCIKETTRRYPALPFLDRVSNKDYTIESTGLTIEKGTKVFISPTGLGFDEQFFPNADKYDPERFADMSKINQEGLYYMPFGEGPRICIGERFGLMNVKVALAHILTHFEVVPCKETKVPLEFVKNQLFILPKGGLPLKFNVLTK